MIGQSNLNTKKTCYDDKKSIKDHNGLQNRIRQRET